MKTHSKSIDNRRRLEDRYLRANIFPGKTQIELKREGYISGLTESIPLTPKDEKRIEMYTKSFLVGEIV